MDTLHALPVDRKPSSDVAHTMHWALLAIPLAAATILAMAGLCWLWLDVLI